MNPVHIATERIVEAIRNSCLRQAWEAASEEQRGGVLRGGRGCRLRGRPAAFCLDDVLLRLWRDRLARERMTGGPKVIWHAGAHLAG
jgi:hypothetical protein